MGWIIVIIVIVLILSGGKQNGNTGSANKVKGGQIDQYVKGQIDRFVLLREKKPSSPETEYELGKVVDNLIDEFLYYSKRPEYERERTAIIMAFCEHTWHYSGTKYPHFRGRLLEDIIYDLINNPPA